ncbi:MAG: electron transport complex subunit E [Gammaproteobacteria bacterium]|nr:electron transport complex subunit E [Gammaproteobacteria bacterium]
MTAPVDSFRHGLWQANPGLVQLLGLCPLLAVSTTMINGLGLGLATLAVITATNVLVSATRHWLHQDLRLPFFVLLIATLVTGVDLIFQAWFFDLHANLGLFIPLIVTNCVILGRAEAFASKNPVLLSLADGVGHGLGFAGVLVLLGGLRELFGRGTLLHGAEQLFGPGAAGLEIVFLQSQQGLLLASLPPGAFLALALLVALRNRLTRDRRAAPARSASQTS